MEEQHLSKATPDVVGRERSDPDASDLENDPLQQATPDMARIRSAQDVAISPFPKHVWLWIALIASVAANLVLGMMVVNRRAHEPQCIQDQRQCPPSSFTPPMTTAAHVGKPQMDETQSVLPLSTQFDPKELATSFAARRDWTWAMATRLEHFLTDQKGQNHKQWPKVHPSEAVSPHRFDMLGPVAPRCPKITKYGKGDGEKRLCDFGQLKQGCVVISIGSNNRWGFEEAVYDGTDCIVHTFDCTGPGTWRVPARVASRVTLHKVCVSTKDFESDDGRTFRTWNNLLLQAGLTSSPSYVKMDIEGHEWPLLASLFREGKPELLPDQIAVELHYATNERLLPWSYRFKTAGEITAFGQMLYPAGYFLIDRNDNPHCTWCSEILLARLRQKSW